MWVFLLWWVVALTSEIELSHETHKRYDGYQVFSLIPRDEEALRVLKDLLHDNNVNFWKEPSQIGQSADLMIHERDLKKYEKSLNEYNIDSTLAIPDVQRLFSEHMTKSSQRRVFKTGDDPKTFTFNQYHRGNEINAWLDSIAAANPSIVSTFTIGKTHDGRQIKGIKIGKPNSGKQGFWLDSGIHAREWIAPATNLYIINQLITGYASDSYIQNMVNHLDFYMIPVLNPDGYEYTWSTDRNWRKTRSGPYVTHSWFSSKSCYGVDPNRNFAPFWGQAGVSTDPCSDSYCGPSALSEVECANVVNWFTNNRKKLNVQAYVTFHSFSQLWMYPYSYHARTYPTNINEIINIAQQSVAALTAVHGTSYRTGTPPDILYAAAGSSMDFTEDEDNVPNPPSQPPSLRWNYALELRPSSASEGGFVLDASQIIPTGEETFAGLKVLLNKMIASPSLH